MRMPGELGYDTGPYVAVAHFCERVLEEKDGVLSVTRLVNQLQIQVAGPDAPDEMPAGVVIQSTLLIVLRAGQARGAQTVQISIEGPDGRRTDGPEVAVNFGGGPEGGINMILPMTLQIESAGLYWTDVRVNKRLMTRVPLEVTYGFTRSPRS
jgi:hypothetical protein